jgi:hypothetical protein
MRILALLLICFSIHCFGQTPIQLKKSIRKQIKENLQGSSLQDTWICCNKDSAYYQNDTIKLYNQINYYYDPSGCCNFVQWDFENLSKFRLVETKMCIEPPTAESYLYNSYQVSWKIERENLFIVINNRKLQIVQKYLVCNYHEELIWNKINSCMVLTIKRL